MDFYTLIATVRLVLQITVLMLLFGSLWLKGKKKFRQHGITMLMAVILHTISIVVVMMPSFGVITSGEFSAVVSAITYVHGIAGILAEVFAVWIIVAWRLRTSLQYCALKKKHMRITLIVWLTALLLGMLMYLHFYTTLLPL